MTVRLRISCCAMQWTVCSFNFIEYGNKEGLWLVLSDRFWPMRPSWWLVELSNVNPAVGTWQLLERFVGVAEGQLRCYDEYHYPNITMELKSFHFYYHLIQVVLFLCLWARQVPQYVLADAGFLYDKATVLSDTIKLMQYVTKIMVSVQAK
jgi:hypothetical protein